MIWRLTRHVAVAVFCGAAVLATPLRSGAEQARVSNGQTETRSAAQGLDREVRAIGSRPGATWIGYRAPMVPGTRQMCCYDSFSGASTCCGTCRLESGSGAVMSSGDVQTAGSRILLEPPMEFVVLARLEGGTVGRLRTFTPECELDAGGMPVVWFNDVKPDDSIAWLSSVVTSNLSSVQTDAMRDDGRRARVVKPAIGAIALHQAAAADRVLESFVAPTQPEWLRSDTAFWLGSARGEPGARLLARMIGQDPSEKVRDKVTFALSVSKTPSSTTTLIEAAKNDRSARVRGRALVWLARKAGQEAVAAIADVIENDPETTVKKRAVFALSQLPKDEGVPKLIEVARTNRNPEVRKQAFFWLGQSRDPRAVRFFEDVLLKKQDVK